MPGPSISSNPVCVSLVGDVRTVLWETARDLGDARAKCFDGACVYHMTGKGMKKIMTDDLGSPIFEYRVAW